VRVLYFTRDYTPHDQRFLASLAGSGNRIYYLRLERRGHVLEERPLPEGVESVPWAGGQKPVGVKDFAGLLPDLKRVLGEIEPDLVHAGPIQSAAFLVALAGFQPLVSMSWGYDLLYDADRSVLGGQAARYTLQHSAVLVGDCQAVRQKAVSLGMPGERIVTFPWGVDLEHFNPPQRERPSEGPFILLSTRSWEPVYGVDVLARGFVQAARKRPELRLVMLGGGSQAGLLQEIFSRGGVLERVDFPGQVGQAGLPAYYQSAHLYASASHSDGSSVSLLEAMACGLPAAVSDTPGNREWVEPGVTGWWFPDGDSGALAGVLLEALEERGYLAQMGRAARRVAERRADWMSNFPQLLRAYELALEITAAGTVQDRRDAG
jgi:L-malate glycosyltransferase